MPFLGGSRDDPQNPLRDPGERSADYRRGASTTETIVWWDFLSGGDGIRMKAMLDEFNKEHAGKVKIDATTFGMGNAVLHQSADRGRDGQGPDVMTYHESRMPLGVRRAC